MTRDTARTLGSRVHHHFGPGIILGDSVAARTPHVATFLIDPPQSLIKDCAIPGYSTIGQIGALDALYASFRSDAKWVILATGLNDRSGGSDTSAAMIANYQAAVDHIRSVCPNAKVIVSQMNPAFSFFDALLGNEGSAAVANYKAEWVALNDAIAGRGPTPIKNVHARCTKHTPLLMDPGYANSLNPVYQENPNDLHQNPLGSRIIAQSWQAAIRFALR